MDLDGDKGKGKDKGKEDKGKGKAKGKGRPRDKDVDLTKYEGKAMGMNKELTSILLKSVLNLMQRQRDIESVVLEVYMVKATEEVATGLKDELVVYEENCRQAGRGHSFGPPHLHLWRRLLSTLATLSTTTPECQSIIKKEQEAEAKMTATTLIDLDQTVRMVRLVKTYNNDLKRLIMSCEKNPANEAVVKSLQAAGAQRKAGRAPRGAMEDELERWLVGTFMK